MGHHDIFFKHTFSIKEHAVDFASHVLSAEINAKLDYSTICLENTSYVDKELSEHFSDTVYSCSYEQSKIKIALLFEHKSWPDNNLPYQLNRYMIKMWGYNIKQKEVFVPVIPIVLYHGKENWKPGRFKSCFNNLPEEIAPFIPDFKYIFVDLSHYTDEEIAAKIFTQASLKISLLILKNIFHAEKLEKELRNFFEIGRIYFQEEKGLKFLESIIKYIFQVTEIKTLRVVEAIKPVTPKGGDLAMTTAEKLRQEGKREGSYNTLYSVIQTMRMNGIVDENIAKMMNLDIYIIKKVLNREEVEIPLNLSRGEFRGKFAASYK